MMKHLEHDQTERLKWSLICTCAVYLMAHGYRLFQAAFAGDGLLMIYKDDAAWEVALGRIVHPFLVLLRGGLEVPLLIGLLSALWLGLSVFLMTELLGITSRPVVALTAGICVCNVTLTTTNGAYLFIADYYMLALFLAVCAAVLVWRCDTWWRIALAAVCIALSIGIYQAYICVTLGIILFKVLFEGMPGPGRVMRMAIPFAAGGGAYYIAWRLAQRVLHIWTADGYNGMAGLTDYSGVSPAGLVLETYRRFFGYFMDPEVFVTYSYHGAKLSILWVWIVRLCNVSAAAVLIWYVITLAITGKKTDPRRTITALICLLLMPMALNIICFITKGMEHSLMIYAFVLVYVGALRAGQELGRLDRRIPGGWLCQRLSIILMVPVLWVQLVYAHQFYLKLELMDRAAQSVLTRIAVQVEAMPGYVPGQTPVAFAGIFESSPYLASLEMFDEVNPLGVGKSIMPYGGTPERYMSNVLNIQMDFTDVDAQDSTVALMPCFPEQGSIAWVGDTIVVKLSE